MEMTDDQLNWGNYNNDETMAQLGRAMIDQYVGWCKKYGEPKDLMGWASFAKGQLLLYIESEDDNENNSEDQRAEESTEDC